MSESYVVGNVLQPQIARAKCEPGVDYEATPEFDDEGEPIYPPDGSVQIVFYAEADGSVGINLDLDLAERLWGVLGHTIQTVKHERIVP